MFSTIGTIVVSFTDYFRVRGKYEIEQTVITKIYSKTSNIVKIFIKWPYYITHKYKSIQLELKKRIESKNFHMYNNTIEV